MKLRRALASTGFILFGLTLLYGLTLMVLLIWTPPGIEEWCRPRARKPFSAVAWRSSRFGAPERYKMANDLVRSGRLLGKTGQEVKALLGQESSGDYLDTRAFIGYDLVSQRQFPAKCFLLPSFLFLNTDSWLLEVELEQGTVTRVKIRHT